MDPADPHRGGSHEFGNDASEPNAQKPRELPDDLPRSLDDRRSVPAFQAETEIYDAWRGADRIPCYLPRSLSAHRFPLAV